MKSRFFAANEHLAIGAHDEAGFVEPAIGAVAVVQQQITALFQTERKKNKYIKKKKIMRVKKMHKTR
jgi:hypothetical protein